MKNLIRSEFYRLFKDKGIIVTCILALAFSILGPLLITIGVAFLESTFPGETFPVYAIDQFYPLLGGGSLISIILFFSIVSYSCNDFKFGTIRNKVISGYKRSHIFLSKLIVIVSTGVIVQLVYSILSLLFYSLFLGFNETRGGAFGFASCFQSLGVMLAAVLSGEVFRHRGTEWVFYAGGVLFILTLPVFIKSVNFAMSPVKFRRSRRQLTEN